MIYGIIGFGVLGRAMHSVIAEGLRPYRVRVYDPYVSGYEKIEQIKDAKVVFVSVPTPSLKDTGSQDLSAIYDVCEKLQDLKFEGIVCIRSTLIPGTMDELSKRYVDLKFVHNPEFLTEKNAVEDFRNQKNILVSGSEENIFFVVQAYFSFFPGLLAVQSSGDFKVTEMAKYMHNLMLASKLMIANEFYSVCKHIGADYQEVSRLASSIGKIGTSHLRVPGEDGQMGFGGMCFPKDLSAFVSAFDQKVNLSVLSKIQEKNKKIRSSN